MTEQTEADRIYRDGWAEFQELIEEAAEYVFGERAARELALVVGGQWGDIGDHDRVLVSANMSPCLASMAVSHMQARADDIHAESHRQAMEDVAGGGSVVESMDYSQVPDEIKETIAEIAENLGLTPEQVRFFEIADISDLEDLPPEDFRPIDNDEEE